MRPEICAHPTCPDELHEYSRGCSSCDARYCDVHESSLIELECCGDGWACADCMPHHACELEIEDAAHAAEIADAADGCEVCPPTNGGMMT